MKRFGLPTSDDTILRHLKRRAKANRTGTSIRVVGLDHWASRKGSCVCRKPYPSWWSERIGYPGGMIALILFVLGILASPFKAKSRLEAENAALRQQLIVLRRKVKSRPRLANADRWFFVQLYRWFPSILDVLTIIRPETLVRWHRAGFRRYWHWKSRRQGGRPQVQSELRALNTANERREPAMGRAAHPRRAAQARV